MVALPSSVWLFFRDTDKARWARSAGGTIVAAHQGQFVEQIYVPGLLFRFTKTADALRAALRLQGEINWESIFGVSPAIVVDLAYDPKRLPVLGFSLPGGSILVTQNAAHMVAAEPIDLTLGPTIALEGGLSVQTHLIAPTTQNMGWALPVIDFVARPSRTGNTPPVVMIEMKHSGMNWLRYVPWKLLTLLMGGGMALIFIYVSTLQVTKEMRRAARDVEAAQPDPMDPRAGQISIFKKFAKIFEKEAPTPTAPQEEAMAVVDVASPTSDDIGAAATPIPLGFGTIVIETEPRDAKVFLNGKLVGKKSPVVLENQSNQNVYELKVSKNRYESYVNFFNVEADQKKVINVRLAKK